MKEKWEQIKKSAKDAVSLTLENRLDVLKTAKDLTDSYSNKSESEKKK